MSEGYFLKSERIAFRTWSLDDTDVAIKLWSDPDVTKYVGGPLTHAQIQRRILTERAILRLHNIQYWPIFPLERDELIGYCGLRPYKPSERIYELGVCLKSEFWGKGFALEANYKVIEYAFTILRASSLFAVHNIANTYSKILLLKLGVQYSHDEYSVSTNKYDPAYILTK